MRKYGLVLLIAVLAAGCASASVSSYLSSENQEERIKKLLVGTWNGYIVNNNPWYNLTNIDVTLQIFEVRKKQSGWMANATVNWRLPEYVELYVYGDIVELKIMDLYGGLFTLTPYGNNYLVGGVSYERGRWTPYPVSLKKISR